MKQHFKTRLLSMFLIAVLMLSSVACSKGSKEVHTLADVSATASTEKPTTIVDTPKDPEPGTYVRPDYVKGTKGSEEFSKYCTEYFKDAVKDNLIDLHYYVSNPSSMGITSYDVTFGDVDLTKVGDTSEIEKDLKDLSEFDYDKLTDTQKQTYDVIYDALMIEMKYSKYELYSYTFGESFGVNSQLPVLLAEYTLTSEQDVKDYLKLIGTLPDYYKKLMDYEKLRVSKNLAMSDQLINGIIDQCKSFVAEPDSNYLIDTFNARLDGLNLDDSAKASYIEQNKTIVKEKVIPAYNYLITEFTALLGKGAKTGGVTNYPDYKEYFEYFLRSSVGTNRTPDEVNSLLKSYASSSKKALNEALVKDYSIIDELEDPKYPINEPEKIIEDLKKKISTSFPAVPEVKTNLHKVHPSLSAFLSPAFYISSPVDNSSIQNIYINNTDNTFSGLYPTLAHEGYPGHLYQHLYYSSTKHELIRDIISYTGYSEGWATYIEMMAYNYSGLNRTLAEGLAAYNVYLLCLYGQLDMGVNYYNWDRDTLTKFVASNFGVDDSSVIDDLYGAVIEKTGNYLNYIFGYIEFMELRKESEKKLGDKFNEKDFHKFLLDFGDAPFYIIRNYMK